MTTNAPCNRGILYVWSFGLRLHHKTPPFDRLYILNWTSYLGTGPFCMLWEVKKGVIGLDQIEKLAIGPFMKVIVKKY